MLPTGPYNLPALWEYKVVETIYPDPNALPEVNFLEWVEDHQVHWGAAGLNAEGKTRVLIGAKKPKDVIVTVSGNYALEWEED